MWKHFGFSIVFTIVCLAISAYWGFNHGPNAGVQAMITALTITAILAVMEVSLSFDNAVVNASVLRGWDHFWKMIFLTVGIVIAVFGMRLVFPIVIVAVTADMGMLEVVNMALNDPTHYSEKLMAHHAEIAAQTLSSHYGRYLGHRDLYWCTSIKSLIGWRARSGRKWQRGWP